MSATAKRVQRDSDDGQPPAKRARYHTTLPNHARDSDSEYRKGDAGSQKTRAEPEQTDAPTKTPQRAVRRANDSAALHPSLGGAGRARKSVTSLRDADHRDSSPGSYTSSGETHYSSARRGDSSNEKPALYPRLSPFPSPAATNGSATVAPPARSIPRYRTSSATPSVEHESELRHAEEGRPRRFRDEEVSGDEPESRHFEDTQQPSTEWELDPQDTEEEPPGYEVESDTDDTASVPPKPASEPPLFDADSEEDELDERQTASACQSAPGHAERELAPVRIHQPLVDYADSEPDAPSPDQHGALSSAERHDAAPSHSAMQHPKEMYDSGTENDLPATIDHHAASRAPLPPSHNVRKRAKEQQVYDSDTEDDRPAAPTRTRVVLVSADPFSNRRVRRVVSTASEPKHEKQQPPAEEEEEEEEEKEGVNVRTNGHHERAPSVSLGRRTASPKEEEEVVEDSEQEEETQPRLSATAKGKWRADDAPPPVVTHPMPPPPPKPQSRVASLSSPLAQHQARKLKATSSAVAEPVPNGHSTHAPRVKQRLSNPDFSKPRDAPSPFTAPAPRRQAPLFVRRSEARDLSAEYALRAVPQPGSGSSGEDDSPTGRKRRETFGGFASSPVRRMSDNHGFSPSIVRGVVDGVGRDLAVADAVLGRMRAGAEREALRALGEIFVGEEVAVERVADVPRVDFRALERSRRSSMRSTPGVPRVDFRALERSRSKSHSRRSSMRDWAPPIKVEERTPEPVQLHDEEEDERVEDEPWTAEEDAAIMRGSPVKALRAIDARRGVGAVAKRLALLF